MPHSRRVSSGLVIVANRLPGVIGAKGEAGMGAGDLAATLSSVTADGTQWVGRRGVPGDGRGWEDTLVPRHSVQLSEADTDLHERFANSVLWPLFHGRLRRVELDRKGWFAYRRVNAQFAATVARVTPLGAAVWVHDYHLLLTPGLLRTMRPDLRVGLFLHTPFPSACMFSILPWRREIMECMLGADIIGVQTPQDVANFIAAASRVACVEVQEHTLRSDSHLVEVDAFPTSVDFSAWQALGMKAEAQGIRNRRQLGVDTVLLGLDRLDYTKGITQRLRAFAELLDEGRLDARSCTFVQVAAPTQSDGAAYRDERNEVQDLVDTINTRHQRADGSSPVVYIHTWLDEADVAGWYSAADVLVITSLADGMNLVAKEFVASCRDCSAGVILSEFAGAARNLTGAVIVNPYDIEAIKDAIVSSITMSEPARQARMRAMRATVRQNDVGQWAGEFLARLQSDRCPAFASATDLSDSHSESIDIASERA